MILASIFIGPAGRGDDLSLPPIVRENIASLIRHQPSLPHKLFSHDDIVEFLEDKFPPEVLRAFNTLRPYAYKADLARYCILYELGGIYADISHFFVRALPFDGGRPVVFRDLILSAPWDTNNSVFAAPPHNSALALAIEMVCANVKRQHYGPTYLCPTGPALFGKAWAMTSEPEDLITGASSLVKRDWLRKSAPDIDLPAAPQIQCLLLNGKVATIKRKTGPPGLADLGIADSDNYVDRWNRREVYEGGSK